MTGHQDDDIGGYEPPDWRVRTTGTGRQPDSDGEDGYPWHEEPRAAGFGLGDHRLGAERFDGPYDEHGRYDEPGRFDEHGEHGRNDEHGQYDEHAHPPEGQYEQGEAGGSEAGEANFGEVVYIVDDDLSPVTLPADGGESATPAPRRHGRPSKAEFRRRRILAALALIVVVVLIVVGIGVIYARRAINPGGPLGPVVTVTIPKSSSTSEIGKILAGAGVIREARLFPLYTKLTNSSNLLPGTYRLAKNESYSRVIRILQQGPPAIVDKLTIPEGYTLAQIAARVAALPGLHLSAAKFLAAASTGRVRSQFEPAGVNNLEGLVFPATYQITQGQEETDILQEMVNAFDERVTGLGLVAAAAKLHYTPYQVVTVASIVEREAKLAGDRPNVASTIYNRLARRMPLGADSTQTYYLRLTHPTLEPTVAELDEPSPYNTRLNPGLPPTPIANPGIPSLEAAISPTVTSYLYFVEINPDGQLGFASDEPGFVKLQAECRSLHLC